MALTKIQVNMAADTVLPKDRLVNTLHYECDQAEGALQTLMQSIVTAYQTQWTNATVREWLVRAYDVGPPPQFPLAELLLNEGTAPTSGVPREVAVCLSFYGTRNIPRQRGRIYLPMAVKGGASGVRPSAAIQQDAVDLGVALSNVAPASAEWRLYSPTTDLSWPITNVWCDDEWDTVRSRGLDATDRIMAAV